MGPSIYSSFALNTPTEIRMLTLLPADSNEDAISCLFSKVDLDEKPEYKAISYCWGQMDRHVSITVNNTALGIPENLGVALRYIRASWAPVTLWVDAVCINQDDEKEKEVQIPLMGRLYSSAEATICWIVSSPVPEEAMKVGIYLAFLSCPDAMPVGLRERILNFGGDAHTATRADNEVNSMVMAQSLEAMIFTVLLLLEQLDYWSRTWIVQEILLSKKIILQGALPGKKGCLSWDALRRHIFRETDDRTGLTFDNNSVTFEVQGKAIQFTSAPPRKFMRLAEMRDAWQRGDPQSRDMLSIMVSNFRKESPDPRDKIWGFLGLAGDGGQRLTTVDLSLSVTDVFSSWACAFITEHKSLRVLQHAGIGDSPRPRGANRQHNAPSWVPRWDIGKERNDSSHPYSPSLDHHGLIFNASIARQAECFLPIGKDVLFVRGVWIDRVSGMKDYSTPSNKGENGVFESTPSTCLEWLLDRLGKEAFEAPRCNTTGETVFESFFRTLMTDRQPCLTRRLDRGPVYFYLLIAFAIGVICGSPDERFKNSRYTGDGTCFITYEKSEGVDLMVVHGDSYRTEETTQNNTRTSRIGTDRISLYGTVTGYCKIGHVFFLTERGYMGLGPAGMTESDRICVLYGCSVPLVLREVDGHTILVGECYLQGFMDCMAVEMLERGELKESTFEIR